MMTVSSAKFLEIDRLRHKSATHFVPDRILAGQGKEDEICVGLE